MRSDFLPQPSWISFPVFLKFVGPFAFAYFLSYTFRVVNAVVGPGLPHGIGADAAALGLLTSIYFLTFASTQFPLGIALDRYGPRLVESYLMVVAAAGALVFAFADSLLMLAIGRGLIGFGVSAALMGAFKAFSMVFPSERLPTLNGIHLSAGALGALAGAAPAEFVMQTYGWRGLFVGLAALSLLSALLIAVFGPRHQGARAEGTLGGQIKAAGAILVDPVFVRVALFSVPSGATALAIQGLWAGPWLRDVQGLSPSAAAAVLSVMALAMLAGFLGFGTLATRAARHGVPTLHIAIGGMTVFMVIQLALVVLPANTGAVTWCLYAFFSTTSVLVYPALTSHFAGHLAGRVVTALNFLVFVGSFSIQWLTGVAVDGLTPSLELKGAFSAVFLVLIALQAIGLAVLLTRMPATGRR